MLDSLMASCPTMTAQTLTLGLLGVILSLPAWGYFLTGVWRLWRFISAGRPADFPRTDHLPQRAATLLKEVVFHTELARRPLVAAAHWFVMIGFLLGSIVWFEAYIQIFNPQGSWPIFGDTHAYHLIDEILGIGTVAGILVLITIRAIASRKPERRNRFYGSNARAAHFVEGVVLLEGLGMLLVKASRIATWPLLFGDPHTDFLTIHLAKLLPANATLVSVFALIKLLTGMVWLFVVGQQLRWGVAWHRFLAFFNIFFQRNADGAPALGKLSTPDLSGEGEIHEGTSHEGESHEGATVGVGTIADASWKMLLDATTCTECGRCQDVCPAWNTGKPLSPKKLITAERDAAIDGSTLTLIGNHIQPDELWSCTNCGACVEQCPVDIEHIDHVAGMRRYQVLEAADFPEELSGLFKNLENKGNPWGRNNSERRTWIDRARDRGLTVPILGEDTTMADVEYLYWVGCAGVYDDAAQETTIAVVELLNTAGVPFAVLGDGETCTGDPARRAGNEFLFQMLAEENVDTLNNAFDGVPAGHRNIITTCAHCFNTIRNEYPDFDGHFDVYHHTQLLNRLVRAGRLTPVPRTDKNRQPITYHDPCFLGRHNKIFDPPRELLDTIEPLTEAPRNKNNAMCCGAGGARMFMEENLGTRIADARAEELRDTGATTVAVGCPFCHTMLSGGLKATAGKEDTPIKVRDVAVLMRDSVMVDGKLPTPLPLKPLKPLVRETPTSDTKPETGSSATPADATPAEATPADAVKADAKKAEAVKAQATTAPAPGVPAPGVSAAPIAPGTAAPAVPATPAMPAAPAAPGTVSAPGAVAPAAVPPASMPPAAMPPAASPGAPAAPGAAAPSVQAPAVAAPVTPAAPSVPVPPAAPGAVAPQVPSTPGAPGSVVPAAVAPAAVPPAPVPPAPVPPAAMPPAAPAAPAPGAVNVPTAPSALSAPGTAAPQAPGAVPPNSAGTPAAPGVAAVPPAAMPPAAAAPAPGVSAPGVSVPGAVAPGARPASPKQPADDKSSDDKSSNTES